jgi:hypothetical protein
LIISEIKKAIAGLNQINLRPVKLHKPSFTEPWLTPRETGLARLLFRLRNVPDDEAFEVRELLNEHNISFYETTAGNWGISMPAIWLNDETDYEQARGLLDIYQQERARRMRADYESARARGEAETQIQVLLREPGKTISLLVVIVVFLYLSITAFF